MYIDSDLWSPQKNSRFSAVWLAATNQTLFHRYFKRSHCENMIIDDLCKSIMDYMKLNKPLFIVAKLAYGLTYIYQQQVNFLYEKVSAAMFKQSIVFYNLPHSKPASVNQRSHKQNETGFADIDDEPLLSMENIISELLSGENCTIVQREEDITLRDSEAFSSDITKKLDFNSIHSSGYKSVSETAFENLSFEEMSNTSCAEKQPDGDVELLVDSGLQENLILRENRFQKELESPSIAILGMSVASTSDSHLTQANHYAEDPYYLPDQLSNASISARDYSNHQTLTSEKIEQLDAPNSETTLTARKRRGTKHLIIDKRIKLEAETMKHAMEHSENTLRCQDPRYDITPIRTIRYPLDVMATIFKHPARSTRSLLLINLFKRNTRKRLANIEDELTNEWFDDLQISRNEIFETERFSKFQKMRRLDENLVLNADQLQPLYSDIQQQPTIPMPTVESTNVRDNFDEFSEESLMKLLENLWSNEPDSVTFKTLEKYFNHKLDAVRCFSSLLELVSKRKLEITRTGGNQIYSINRGSKF